MRKIFYLVFILFAITTIIFISLPIYKTYSDGIDLYGNFAKIYKGKHNLMIAALQGNYVMIIVLVAVIVILVAGITCFLMNLIGYNKNIFELNDAFMISFLLLSIFTFISEYYLIGILSLTFFVILVGIFISIKINDSANIALAKSKIIEKKFNINDYKKDLDSCEFLMIVAHPDDETFFGGRELLANPNKYFVICVLDGYHDKRRNDFNKVLTFTKSKGVMFDFIDTLVHKVFYNQTEEIGHIIKTFVQYKTWDKIVTHNPHGEYGHIHHILINKLVSSYALDDNLYYFKFTNKFKSMFIKKKTDELSTRKIDMIKLYRNSQLTATKWFKYTFKTDMIIKKKN